MSLPVVTVGRSAGECVAGLEKLRGPVTVVRRCEDLPELIAACQTGIARAAIVSDGAGELTATLLERLNASDVAVVVLADDEARRRRLDALGVRHVRSDMEPADLARVVSEAVEDAARPLATDSAVNTSLSDTGGALHTQPGPTAPGAAQRAGGRVLAVWGPAGSPGRTTVAVNLAAELAVSGRRVLLIDADTYGASVAASLGLLDESAGLAQACRYADQGKLDQRGLQRLTTNVVIRGSRLGVLTGITRADRWAELRAPALAEVIECARSTAEVTVIDCGFCLEADEELSFDTMAPRRNAATLRCLELADTVFAVGAADAIGVPRLVRALTELQEAVPTCSPKVVFNKVRAAAVGRSPERQLREAWERFGPLREISAFLPADFEAADSALLGGSALVETAEGSPLRKAIASLAGAPVEQHRRRAAGGGHNEVKFPRNGVRLVAGGPQRSGP